MSGDSWGIVGGVVVVVCILAYALSLRALVKARRWRALAWMLAVSMLVFGGTGYAVYARGYYDAFRGGIAESNGELDEALRWFGRAYERNPDAFMVAYDIACCYAKTGDSEQCFPWLARALESSYGDYAREQARSDEDFASVRDAARFRELVGAADS